MCGDGGDGGSGDGGNVLWCECVWCGGGGVYGYTPRG